MCFWKLGLLSPWFDEADELIFLRGTLANSINIPAGGGHPPLYFAVIYYWMRLPFGLDWVVQARALSVIFALLATLAADRFWARELSNRWRWAFLTLWSLSPFLLLYSRMSRSYSLQLLIGTVVVGYLSRAARLATATSSTRSPSTRSTKFLALWLAIGVYVHAIPGFALLATTNLQLLWRRKFRDALWIDAVVGILYLPWLYRLLTFLPTWGKKGGNLYALTGAPVFEIPLKLAYWAFSFTMGEAVPDTVLIFGAVVGVGVAVLVIAGARRRPDLVWIAAPAAFIGFIGVARWNSYPFVPARMIFLFPIFLMLLVTGASLHRRLGSAVLAAMLVLCVSGIWSYFHLAGFRNKQYPMPVAELAARIGRASPPGTFAVIVDSTNADPIGMEYQLGPVLRTGEPATPRALDQALADPNIRVVWFLRSTHDISPTQLNRQFEQKLAAVMRETVYPVEPFTPLELKVAQAAGVPHPASHFQELLKFEW
jgi:hypothetical protein